VLFLKTTREDKHYPLSGHPVAVIASFKKNGDFIPLYICYEDETEELHKVKIESIHSLKDKFNLKIFECSFIEYGYRYTINLGYDISTCKWAMM
jgi:hypothetical protein